MQIHDQCALYMMLIIIIHFLSMHMEQRIGNTLRQGRVDDNRMEYFVEAVKDPSTGLTYPALTGVRKQSVQDVERLFGEGVIKFMEAKQYMPEAIYLRVVRNWRRAIDERGLGESTRQQFLQEFKDFICADLMPWYIHSKDFSLLEVNRCVTYSVHLVNSAI